MREQPHAHLEQWRIGERGADWYLMGFCTEAASNRWTTPVQLLDLARQIAVTASGRQYQLVGPPAVSGPDLDSGVDDRLRIIAVCCGLRDITAEVTGGYRH